MGDEKAEKKKKKKKWLYYPNLSLLCSVLNDSVAQRVEPDKVVKDAEVVSASDGATTTSLGIVLQGKEPALQTAENSLEGEDGKEEKKTKKKKKKRDRDEMNATSTEEPPSKKVRQDGDEAALLTAVSDTHQSDSHAEATRPEDKKEKKKKKKKQKVDMNDSACSVVENSLLPSLPCALNA